ncbi:hypothetical protein [uncultured Roseobacter sp.]|uniref:hypothetical protein n=1 Tax=uncultured Roseobacter sp. TaxID=114847 RepID=UPI002601CEFD|nr:hypothetical protein [uncultured Roseobacter sp.]
MTSPKKRTASEEIALAIAEAAQGVSVSVTAQTSTERLLISTLDVMPPTHRIENTIDVILEEDSLSDKQ